MQIYVSYFYRFIQEKLNTEFCWNTINFKDNVKNAWKKCKISNVKYVIFLRIYYLYEFITCTMLNI